MMISEGNSTRCHTQRTVATSLPANLSLKPNTGTEAFLLPLAWLLGVCLTCRFSVALLWLWLTLLSLLFIPASVTSASLCPVTVEPEGRSFLCLERRLNCLVTRERTSAVCWHTPSWVSLPLCSVIRAAVVDMRPALIRLQCRT